MTETEAILLQTLRTQLTFSQSEFHIRCEWGENGVAQLAPISDVVVIVDVFSFSTCIQIATHRRAVVFPYRMTLNL